MSIHKNGYSVPSKKLIKKLISAAKGDIIPDVLLRGGKIVNLFSREIYETNIAICGAYIAGIDKGYTKGKKIYDLEGRYILPGFIDSHTHMESTMLSPEEYAKAVLPHGTTCIIIDPHEIANVMGIKGLEYLVNATADLPLKVYIMASSCVPSTNLETAGSTLTFKEIKKLLDMERVIGLAEMMNFPGVINKDDGCLDKILQAKRKNLPVDGHSPSLSGLNLNAYIAAGINSDHEIISEKEALEKLRLGMHIMIREGSSAKNMKDYIHLVTPENSRRFFFVSDDLHPTELITNGHIDYILRKAVKHGLDPVSAAQMATLNPAGRFKLEGMGELAPGSFADIAVLSDLETFKVEKVFVNGKLAAENGITIAKINGNNKIPSSNSIYFIPFNAKRLEVKAETPKMVNIITLTENQLFTKWTKAEMKPENGVLLPDIEQDILKIAVIERHKFTGNIAVGFVQGFNLKKGAIASSVAHDSHNIVTVGTNDADMEKAVSRIKEIGGGFTVCLDKRIIAELPLPIAGLISAEPLSTVVKQEGSLRESVKTLGSTLPDPFGILSFLTLPVIPELKLTDKGLVDVTKFQFVPLFEK